MDLFQKYKALIFDLDNTLYDEKDYLFPVYHVISELAARKDKIEALLAEQYLKREFITNGRKDLFNKFISHFKLRYCSVEDFLQILRTNRPEKKMQLYKSAATTLQSMSDLKKQIFILTNGNPEQQRNKVAMIDWQGIDQKIQFIYANETEKKPSPLEINRIILKCNLSKKDIVFIGDSMEDRQCALNAGIAFRQVMEIFPEAT